MKREQPSEVEGFSLKRLKIIYERIAFYVLYNHLYDRDFDTIMKLIWSESDYLFGYCLFL